MTRGTARAAKWIGLACVLVVGLAATATWKPGLYRQWLGRGDADETSAAAERQ